MTAREIVEELRTLGAESIKKVLRNHGVQEPFFGVKIGDMKKIQKRIKKDYQLALDLYDTGNYDAMYLAGLIADDAKMTKKDLNQWVKSANGGALASATVPWVAAGSQYGYEIALEWIESEKENVAVAGLLFSSRIRKVTSLAGRESKSRSTSLRKPMSWVPWPTLNESFPSRLPASRLVKWCVGSISG